MAVPRARPRASESGFARIVSQHQAGLWRYLRYLGCDAASAEDLVQETFLAIWRKPFEVRGDRETAAYLRRAARNRFLMAVRRQRVRPAFTDLREADLVWSEACGDDHGEAYRGALELCLDELGERARRAVRLFYGGTRSRSRVAQELSMTVNGVKTLLRRTRDTLRSCIARRLT